MLYGKCSNIVYFSSQLAVTKAMSAGLDLVQSIFSSLSALTKLMLTCL